MSWHGSLTAPPFYLCCVSIFPVGSPKVPEVRRDQRPRLWTRRERDVHGWEGHYKKPGHLSGEVNVIRSLGSNSVLGGGG